MIKRLIHSIQVLIRWLAIWIGNIVSFFTHDMWLVKHEDLGKWKSRMLRDAKIVYLMMDTFSDQKIGFQVTALAYQSMMSVVPFLAIAFYLTAGVGLSDQLADFLYANVNNERLIGALLNAANNILTTAQSGLFGFISMLSFIWILIWLMLSVRRVFNNVWKVEKEQNFLRSLGIGFGVLLLSPFVILLFFSGTVLYSQVLTLIFPGDFFLFGHIHVPRCEECGGIMLLNPGSVSIPKNGSERGYMTLDGMRFSWHTLDGVEYRVYQAG